MRRFLAAGLTAAAAINGCKLVEAERQTTFVESEYAQFAQPGSGGVRGQAFLRTVGGDVKTAAGNPVFLNPVTSYSTEFFERRILGGQVLEQPDQRVAPFVRQVVADADGRFAFGDLPAGDYYAYVNVFWQVYSGGTSGSIVKAKVTVRDGQTTDVLLTE